MACQTLNPKKGMELEKTRQSSTAGFLSVFDNSCCLSTYNTTDQQHYLVCPIISGKSASVHKLTEPFGFPQFPASPNGLNSHLGATAPLRFVRFGRSSFCLRLRRTAFQAGKGVRAPSAPWVTSLRWPPPPNRHRLGCSSQLNQGRRGQTRLRPFAFGERTAPPSKTCWPLCFSPTALL